LTTNWQIDLDAYCKRIGYTGPLDVTIDTLCALHRAHMLSVPFENLDIHMNRWIHIDLPHIYDKVVGNRRGGFCYEQNGLFSAVLRAIGFKVVLMEARVHTESWDDSIPFEHLALRVDLEERWLVDVGFGDAFLEPLRFDVITEQVVPPGMYRVAHDGVEGTMFAKNRDGTWIKEYMFHLKPRQLSDFEAGCEYTQTSPQSSFTQKRVCSLALPDGRLTLRDDRLIRTQKGQRVEQPVADEAMYQQLLLEHFGITWGR